MLCVLLGAIVALESAAQEEDAALRAAMYLNGASSEEELGADEIERLQGIGKVRVNSPGRNARALLSEYQLATLDDYRRRCGDILSWEELALVDGFGKEAVEALKPYLSLWSDNLPGAVDTVSHFKAGLLVRATEKNIGTKLKAEGKYWQLVGAVRTKSWGSRSYDWTVSAEYGNGRWSALVGGFNVRYGQGLGIWSGFSMNSFSSIGAFIKRPTGIRPICSFTPSQHRGLAGEYHLGRWSLAAFGDLSGNIGLHTGYVSMRSQLGLTMLRDRISVDFAINYKGINIVGEVASSSSSLAGVLASTFKIGDVKLALQTRAIPSAFSGKSSGEYGAAAGSQWSSREMKLSLTADASLLPIPQKAPGRKQLRIYGLWQWKMSESMALETRITGRYRNWEPSRSDIRIDLKYSNEQWFGASRIEGDYCSGPGILGYLETGYKSTGAAAYLRIGAFSTSAWSSRIYCYERDAPGSFTVPAYYGQGLTASLYGSMKARLGARLRAKLYLRGACVLKKDTKPSPSLHLQVQIDT